MSALAGRRASLGAPARAFSHLILGLPSAGSGRADFGRRYFDRLSVLRMKAATLSWRSFSDCSWAYTMWPDW